MPDYLKYDQLKGLSIESYNGALKFFWNNLLSSYLSQNRRWEEYTVDFRVSRSTILLCPTVYAQARTRDLWKQNGGGLSGRYSPVSIRLIYSKFIFSLVVMHKLTAIWRYRHSKSNRSSCINFFLTKYC